MPVGPQGVADGKRRAAEGHGDDQCGPHELGREPDAVEEGGGDHHGQQQPADHLQGAPDDRRAATQQQGGSRERCAGDDHLSDGAQGPLDVAERERDQAEGSDEEEQDAEVGQSVDGQVGSHGLLCPRPPAGHGAGLVGGAGLWRGVGRGAREAGGARHPVAARLARGCRGCGRRWRPAGRERGGGACHRLRARDGRDCRQPRGRRLPGRLGRELAHEVQGTLLLVGRQPPAADHLRQEDELDEGQ